LTGIEHFTPVSHAEEKGNDYDNCFYACRLCNGARQDRPRQDEQGRNLIHLVGSVWGDRFALTEAGHLVPGEADRDAQYTAEAYDLNDPRKVVARQTRKRHLEAWMKLFQEGPRLVASLISLCETEVSSEKASRLLEAAFVIQQQLEQAREDIRRYAAVPEDASLECRCGNRGQCSLPSWLEEQIQEMA